MCFEPEYVFKRFAERFRILSVELNFTSKFAGGVEDGLAAEEGKSPTFVPSPGPIDNVNLFANGEFKKDLKHDKVCKSV